MTIKVIVFVIINFAALGLGGWLMGEGASSEWYQNLNKAPWTPPGWTFGAAWFTIMVCFGFYMARLWELETNHNYLLLWFVIQWILNVAWNPAFFRFHQPLIGLIIITALTLLVGYVLARYGSKLKGWSLFIAPYFIWLLIATSLNGYIYLKNQGV